MKIGIVGLGHVGTAMKQLFTEACVYDEPKGIGLKEEINTCDVCFVCVPTPMNEDGSCNTTIVEHVIDWLQAKVIVIRSTVPVGFTEKMINRTKKRILFQPEYYGETVRHPYADLINQEWITIGGDKSDADYLIMAYQNVITSEVLINLVDSKTAELAKYMENSFLATKVVFCNEFFDLAGQLGVNYNELRETWLLDPRMGRSHTFVYPENRGYGGACLPKDIASIIHQGENLSDMTLLKAVVKKNKYLHECD